ncbi:polysulfide reductase NrfD [Phycicoccus ginsengisoli]
MTTNPLDADRPPELPRGQRRRNGAGGKGDGSGRRRRDESVMVPDAQFSSYYGHNVVKPAPWGHEIAAYLFLGGLAGGSGLVAAGGAATGRPALRRTGRVAALVSVALGGAALAKDLGRPERALNMLRVAKLTSPMSVGSWILTAFGTFAGAGAATELAQAVLPRGSRLARLARFADPAATVGTTAFSMPLAAYTAVLLADTTTPTWRESYRELPFVFVGSANAAAAGLALVTTPAEQNGPARRLAAVSAAVELGASELMERRMHPLVAEPLHEGRAGGMLKAAKALTAGGAVGAALFGRNRTMAGLSGVALLAGSVLTRFGIFEAGMESAKDPKYTVTPQKERLEERRRRGETKDSITTGR